MDLILYIFIYSVLGWFLEVGYYYYKKKTFVNRGFYHGPIVPIYGVAMVALHLLMFTAFESFITYNIINLLFIFLLITAIATLLELIGGSVLFNLFETRWWDYSDEAYNYKGYVSLKFSLIWGAAGTFAFYALHLQVIYPYVQNLDRNTQLILITILLGLFMIDGLFTMKSLIEFKLLVREANKRLVNFEIETDSILQNLSDKAPKSLKSILNQVITTIRSNERLGKIKDSLGSLKNSITLKDAPDEQTYSRLNKIINKLTSTRLYRAFPELKIKLKRKKDDDHES